MKTHNFPFIALGMGLLALLIIMKGNELQDDGSTTLPILTMLVISEFAFFVTAAGAYIGVRHILATGNNPLYTAITVLCAVISVGCLLLGIELWPL